MISNKPKLFSDICKLFLKEVNCKFKPWEMKDPHMVLKIYKHGISTIFHTFCFNVEHANDDIIKLLEDSILYYIEYVAQSQEEKLSFLNLTPHDASRFLYKKNLLYSGSNSNCLETLLPMYHRFNKFLNEIEIADDATNEAWWQDTFVNNFPTVVRL